MDKQVIFDKLKSALIEDFEMDEAGFVPTDLKRGVLSEDALYNLLGDIVSLHEQMQEICGD